MSSASPLPSSSIVRAIVYDTHGVAHGLYAFNKVSVVSKPPWLLLHVLSRSLQFSFEVFVSIVCSLLQADLELLSISLDADPQFFDLL